MTREKLILSHLVENEQFARQTLPFLKHEYFSDRTDKELFKLISNYFSKYNICPSKEALVIELSEQEGIQDEVFKEASSAILELKIDEKTSLQYIIDVTEKFCQDRAIYNALMTSISIIEDEKEKLSRGSIPQILTEALSVSFDNSVGHNYLEDWEERFDYYHKVENKIPFDIELFNKITGGGLPKKSLTIFLAGPHVGKTMTMCHCAAYNLYSGKNVLYISLEMSEEAISKRIDSNLLEIPMVELDTYPKDMFEKKIKQVKGKTRGQLIVKEYPTASASAANFRHLLSELKLKKQFVPDIIYIDYMNICASSRLKRSAGANMYEYVKSIGEELRGLAVEFDVPMVSSAQVNRGGSKSSDFDMSDIAECIYVKEQVTLVDGTKKSIEDVKIGDQITSNDGYKTVIQTHEKNRKQCVRIKLKSGKEIIVSKEHVFPAKTITGEIKRLSVSEGLSVGCILNSEQG